MKNVPVAAKKNGKVNKSEEIRKILAARPTAWAKLVVDILASRGINVAQSLVYVVKQSMKQPRQRSGNTAQSSPVDAVLKVKKLADEVGGLTQLKRLVDALVAFAHPRSPGTRSPGLRDARSLKSQRRRQKSLRRQQQ